MANLTPIQTAQLNFIQQNFRKLRSICEWSASDVAEVLGITRQTINNIELGKTQLNPLQYIGFVSMLEYCRKSSPEVSAYIDICLAHFPRSEQVSIANLLSAWFANFPIQFPKAGSPKDTFRNVQSVNLIEHIVEQCKIFVTPDIFQGNKKCLEELGAAALQFDNPLIVPAKAFFLIETSLSEDCKNFVAACRSDGRIKFYESEQDTSLAEIITTQMLRLRSKYPLCLITGDRVLASDIQTLGTLQSVSGHEILTARIIDDTYLELWDVNTDNWECLISSEDDSTPHTPEISRSSDIFTDKSVSTTLSQDISDTIPSQRSLTVENQCEREFPHSSEKAPEKAVDISWRRL